MSDDELYESMKQRAEAINNPILFRLKGKLQHEIAVKALRHTGANPVLADSLDDNVRKHAYIFQDFDEDAAAKFGLGLETTFLEQSETNAQGDILYGLAAMAGSPDVSGPDRQAAAFLLETLQTPEQ